MNVFRLSQGFKSNNFELKALEYYRKGNIGFDSRTRIKDFGIQ
jgi:hypothetical protein